MVKHEKQQKQDLVTPSSEYKLPLVWIDLEMTGKQLNMEGGFRGIDSLISILVKMLLRQSSFHNFCMNC